MRPVTRPPIGVMPWWLWQEMYPDPTLAELVHRHAEVCAAIARYRAAGLPPAAKWLAETLGEFGRAEWDGP